MPENVDLIGWVVIGFLAGAVAGWFVPDRGRMGCLGTTLLGIVGALVGGWFWTQVLNQSRAGGFLGALLIAILGSALLLILVRGMSRR
ncbi:MAG: GlsB/YeaQ/YmgE family stress response membrane protein [Actinomycetota bacterium]|nr:GlsB/YeaQ/YmgE family stress response membrane protein [Actinomycetota bacterium]